MPEAFLILLAGGILLAAAISDPRLVTLLWLRLCGILALSMLALSAVFAIYRGGYTALVVCLYIATAIVILGQLATVQTAKRNAQRWFAGLGTLMSMALGVLFLQPTADHLPLRQMYIVPILSAIGVAAMTGLSLMDMLLGHAYLTASKMTIAPFLRINLALMAALLFRAVVSIGGSLLAQRFAPVEMMWARFGLYILTRWFVGLLVPAIFIFMAHDCIRRRSTQSATGILYVAGVVIFIGEIIAVYLVRETGLPF